MPHARTATALSAMGKRCPLCRLFPLVVLLVVAPDNDHYGRDGVYRNCRYVESRHLLCENETITQASCRQNRLCYGESIWDSAYPAIRRLTFNPLFAELASSVVAFIEATGKR